MFTVIILLLTGMLIGFGLHKWPMKGLGHVINMLIWLLLFLLGIEVGSNKELMRNLPTLGVEACILALGGTFGSVLAAWALWKRLARREDKERSSAQPTDQGLWQALRGSIIIVGFFLIGICAGLSGQIPVRLMSSDISFYALCALMGCVGLSVGHSPEILHSFRSLNPRLAWLPLLTIAGTLAGSALIGLLLTHRSLSDCLAVGSGLGYYSLSSIFITEYRGAELGTVALLTNICRELITLLAAPILVNRFGPLAPISAGGATTMDTTLPVITQASGDRFIVISIFHGFVVDFSVPFLVTFWCSM